MIIQRKKRLGLAYRYVWFAAAPDPAAAVSLVVYAQCKDDRPHPGFARRPFLTRMIDLGAEPQEILSGISGKGPNEVRRARRDGVVVRPVGTAEEFLAFYGLASPTIGGDAVALDELAGWGRDIVGLAAEQDGDPLAMHCYIIDRHIARARLLYSVSLHRQEGIKHDRAQIGRANRLLHYDSMLYFKEQGLQDYDLGGWARDSLDPRLASIAKFKASLGGREVLEHHYTSWPLLLLQRTARMAGSARALAQRREKHELA